MGGWLCPGRLPACYRHGTGEQADFPAIERSIDSHCHPNGNSQPQLHSHRYQHYYPAHSYTHSSSLHLFPLGRLFPRPDGWPGKQPLSPSPGSDDPHQAVDLADRQPDSQIALAGRVVQAVLGGSVAAVIRDRFPYGNALLVETPLEGLPNDLPAALGLTEPASTPIPNLALNCPDVVQKNFKAGQSLYLLYAHLQQAPTFQPGDPVTCGQAIGIVGDSGNALNPHLHLEVRLGPSGVRFNSLAHYENSATLEEMDNYCTWRVRGVFRLVDPMRLLGYSEP